MTLVDVALVVRCPECGAPSGVPCMTVDLQPVAPHARRRARATKGAK